MTKQTNYIPQLYDFLNRLSRNNNRDWFKANRAEYDDLRCQWEADLGRLIADMSQWDSRIARQTPKSSAFRIYRDIRFSQDKSPFKTYFSALISPYGKSMDRASYYLQMGPCADSGLYGGLWCPDAAMLRKLRKAMTDNIEELRDILADSRLEKEFPGWCGSMLKTVPKGYDRNHPDADLLRLKDIGKWHPCSEKWFSDPSWVSRASELFSLLKPLIDFLNYSIEE